MWGWLDGVVGGLKTVWETLTNLPQLIWNAIKGGFDSLANWLHDIWDGIKELPTLILDGIKDIFIPDTLVLENRFNEFLDTLKFQFNFDTDFFTSVFDDEKPVTDITTDYFISGVGNFNLKMFDSKFFIDGVEYFRPFIRGFLVLLMAFYNVRMMLSFIRQDAGVVAGKVAKGKEE